MRILVLTKNISYELELQQELQSLNNEVFVTRNEFDDYLLTTCAELFNCLFVSETFSDKEFFDIYYEITPLYTGRVVRILPEDETPEQASKEGVNIAYVHRSFINLRDFLGAMVTTKKGNPNTISKEEFHRILSDKERMFFTSLENGEIISRQDMCWLLWGEGETASKKSQLSTLAKRLNIKLDEYNYTDRRIKTRWGKGYMLQ